MPSRISLAAAAILLPAIVFLSFPPAIIGANSHEITFTRTSLYVAWALLLAFSVILAAFSLYSRRFLVVLTALAVNVLMWNAAFPHYWLNSWQAIAFAAAAEIAVLCFVLWVAFKVPLPLLTRSAAMAAILTGGFAASEHYALWQTLPSSLDEPTSPHRADRATEVRDGRATGNVYHIVMDAFAASYMKKRAAEGSVDLSGYTFYPGAHANYGRTNLSMRSVFTGELHPDPISDWNAAFSIGFSKDLREAGVSTQYFPYYRFYCDPEATICRGTEDLYAFYRKHIGTTFLVDILFQSSLPVSLRNYLLDSVAHEHRPTETWDYGFSVTSWLRGLFDRTGGYPKWRWPFQALTMDTLEDFLATERTLPASGRYVYLHLMMPHGPHVFDPDCDIVPPKRRKSREESEAEQFACSVTLVERITALLRDLGRFDNSLVIFHADHGSGYMTNLAQWDQSFADDGDSTFDRNSGDLSTMPSGEVEKYSSTLMLVHKPGQADFRTSSRDDVQLLDVAPTVRDFFGLINRPAPGVSLLAPDAPSGREKVYYEAHTAELRDIDRFAKFIRKNGGWTFSGWTAVNGPVVSERP